MALTKPRNYPFPAPPGERAATCDICGIEWYRSDLVRTPDGFLTCPDDIDGRDTVTLTRLGQQDAQAALAELNRPRRGTW